MTNKPNEVRVSRELLPCPYCGCAARYVAADYVDNSGETWPFAECDACNTGAPVEFWNKRAQAADQQGEPVAWMHVMHLELEQEIKLPSLSSSSIEVFGKPDVDYDASFSVTCDPLYGHAQPATAKVDEKAEFEQWADRHFAYADYSCNYAGVYLKDWMRHSFAAWQARAKLNGSEHD